MALVRIARAAALVLMSFAAPAAAQEAVPAAEQQPTAAGEDILVTGLRPLVVDIDKVAQSCIACRRALTRIHAAAAPRSRGGAAPTFDEEGIRPPQIGARAPADVTAAGAGEMIRYSEVQTRARRTSRRAMTRPPADVTAMADRYLQNLMTYVSPIVDREIAARRAPAAYAADDPAARGLPAVDITDAVIAQLDRDHGDADLLAGPRPG